MNKKNQELQWVKQLQQMTKIDKTVVAGIGDDCACIKSGSKYLLLKSDLLYEGVHFVRSKISYTDIGKRAVARVFSDFAACGGWPRYIGVSAGLPADIKDAQRKALLEGVLAMCQKYGCLLIGGDTAVTPQLMLDVWGMGQCNQFVSRAGARVGDYIFVSGPLGRRPFSKSFEPRIKEAQYLVKNYKITSMIDISDGFLLDLQRILMASNKGAHIMFEDIPVSHGEQDLSRGEDYELIFTVSLQQAHINRLYKKFYCVGKIVSHKEGYTMSKAKKTSVVNAKGYMHF